MQLSKQSSQGLRAGAPNESRSDHNNKSFIDGNLAVATSADTARGRVCNLENLGFKQFLT